MKDSENKSISRRKFTKTTLKSMAGAIFLPNILPSNVNWKGANDRILMASIGLGSRGGNELEHYILPLEGSYSVAMCDVHQDRRDKWTSQVNQYYADKGINAPECKAYLHFEEILERTDIDAVHITTPDHWHVVAALKAAKAGKNIMLAKPLGLSYPHYKKLEKAVDKNNVRFHYATQQRTFEHMKAVVDMIREGKIGDIERVDMW